MMQIHSTKETPLLKFAKDTEIFFDTDTGAVRIVGEVTLLAPATIALLGACNLRNDDMSAFKDYWQKMVTGQVAPELVPEETKPQA